jgi:ABC-2 type transport system ATP-binding protein
MTRTENAIEIRELTKYYPGSDIPALDSVSLIIKRGHIFGLLGPNGAGKTTMIRILCGLLKPTDGEVYVGGYSLMKDMHEIRKLIGVVPQEIALYPSLTAKENLLVYGGICGVKASSLKKRIEALLTVYGLEKNRHIQVGRFSGGMKRRLNLVAGLLHSPKILFLDEPTVGVDVQSKAVIIDSLRQINQDGTTIIYTSHYLEEAENLCTYVAIIDEGKVLKQGNLAEIKSSEGSTRTLEEIFIALTGKTLRD